jgi:hypothetical protein
MCATWVSTVRRDTYSRLEISGFGQPSAIRPATRGIEPSACRLEMVSGGEQRRRVAIEHSTAETGHHPRHGIGVGLGIVYRCRDSLSRP